MRALGVSIEAAAETISTSGAMISKTCFSGNSKAKYYGQKQWTMQSWNFKGSSVWRSVACRVTSQRCVSERHGWKWEYAAWRPRLRNRDTRKLCSRRLLERKRSCKGSPIACYQRAPNRLKHALARYGLSWRRAWEIFGNCCARTPPSPEQNF